MTTTQHPYSDLLSAYIDNEITPEEHTEVERLVQTNEAARMELADLRMIKQVLGDLDEPALPRSFALPADMAKPAPLASPVPGGTGSDVHRISAKAAPAGIRRFEPMLRYLSVAAVIALVVLGAAQFAGFGDADTTNVNNSAITSETNANDDALQDQEPALARGEVREQGDSAAANAQPLTNPAAQVDTSAKADDGLTALQITTVGVGIVAVASVSGWILIRNRAG